MVSMRPTVLQKRGYCKCSEGCMSMKSLAPQVGFEPTTLRLTAEPVPAASRYKQKTCTVRNIFWGGIGGTVGVWRGGRGAYLEGTADGVYRDASAPSPL